MNRGHQPEAIRPSFAPLASPAAPLPVAVLLAGGDAAVREGLKRLFEASPLQVAGELPGVGAPFDPARFRPAPSLLLAIDPCLQSDTAPPWQTPQPGAPPCWRVVALFSRGGDREVIAALQAGAAGCLFTGMPRAALVQAIQLVALGGDVFPTRLSRAFVGRAIAGIDPHLTPRERDILRGLVDGCSNKEIANRLGTADMTVKAQLRHLLRKIGAGNRTQAALWARENGFG